MGFIDAGLPLSPAPSPVPSIRRLRINSPPANGVMVNEAEQDFVRRFMGFDSATKSSILRQLLATAPREVLLEAQDEIAPRLRHDPFKVLPVEISLRILSHIRDPQSLAAAAQVSRLWYFLLSDDSTWKQLCRDHHFRRLSAAGSYVHKWTESRERASSQAIDEEDDYMHDAAASAPEEDGDQDSTGGDAQYHEPTASTNGHSSVAATSDDSAGARRQSSDLAPTSRRRGSSARVLPRRRTDPRRNSLLGERFDGFSWGSMPPQNGPIVQYGLRLPNFSHSIAEHLSTSADPVSDPVGEAFYDPEACVTSPPDSYRSHFRQQYLLSQAWSQGGRLAGRYQLTHQERVIVTTVLMQDGYIVVALDSSLILVFSDDGKLLRSLYGHVMGVWALALRGSTLVSGGCDRDVREWDLETGSCRKIMRGHSSTVRCLAMANKDVALSGGRDAIIRVWDLKNGKSMHRLVGHCGSVRRLETTEVDGTPLAVSASYDCTAKVWNLETGELLHTLAGHTNQIYSLAVDSGRIATGSLDHSICIWDLATGANLATLRSHSALVGQLAMQGNTLVSGGSDGAVRIWDLETMTCKHRIAAHDNTVTSLKLKDERIITGGSDKRVLIWNLRTGECIRQLHKEGVSTVWGVAAKDDRLLTVYSEAMNIVVELMSFVPTASA